MRLFRAALLAALVLSPVARADDVWVWSDASGETHYTNDLESIPSRARAGARKLAADGAGSAEVVSTGPAGKPSAIPGVVIAPDPTTLLPDGGVPPAPPSPAAVADGAPPPVPIELADRVPEDGDKVAESQWRGLFRKANERVRRSEQRLARTREALAKTPGSDLTAYDAAGNLVVDTRAAALRAQIQDDERAAEEAREGLHDLERAAAREAIPLEWRR